MIRVALSWRCKTILQKLVKVTQSDHKIIGKLVRCSWSNFRKAPSSADVWKLAESYGWDDTSRERERVFQTRAAATGKARLPTVDTVTMLEWLGSAIMSILSVQKC